MLLKVSSDNGSAKFKYPKLCIAKYELNELRSWNSLFVEYSSPEHSRLLSLDTNPTEFFVTDEMYVNIPLEIESPTSPESFKVLYYAVIIYVNNGNQKSNGFYSGAGPIGDGIMLVDLSSWIIFPHQLNPLQPLLRI